TADRQRVVPIPPEIEGVIDTAYWGKLGYTLNDDATPQQLHSMLGTAAVIWTDEKLPPQEVFEKIQDVFEDWTDVMWQKVEMPIMKFFRSFLMESGTWMKLDRRSVRENCVEAIMRDRFRMWFNSDLK
ncbi:hypothetical protein QBC37DRAFT_247142, partial [Rhypophila decipiens]